MTNQPHRAEMVILAREEMGLTQEKAAEQLGISQGMLSKIESGLVSLSEDVEANLCRFYGRPPEFFRYQESIEAPTFVKFRQKGKVAPDVANRFHARITIAAIEIRRLLIGAELTTEPLPFIDPDTCRGGAREVAQRIRRMCRLPQGPLKNLMKVIEGVGCLVVKIDFGTHKVDGCSGFIGDLPVIFINEGLTAVRQRLTLAHEFGHLVMHRYPSPDAERQAFLFACELLMPSDNIKPMLKPLSLDKLARLKLYWLVSIQALIWNAEMLECLKASTARYYRAKLYARGGLEQEPYDNQLAPEQPTLLPEILCTYKHDLHYTEDELDRLLMRSRQTSNEGFFGGGLRVVK